MVSDPLRAVRAVTAGVAFLAAGSILSRAARCRDSPRERGCGWQEPSVSPAASASGRSPDSDFPDPGRDGAASFNRGETRDCRGQARSSARAPGGAVFAQGKGRYRRPVLTYAGHAVRRLPIPALFAVAFGAGLPAMAQTSRPVPELGTAPIPRQLPTLPTPGQPPAASDEVKDPKTGCGVVMMNAEPNISNQLVGCVRLRPCPGQGCPAVVQGRHSHGSL